MSAPATRLAEPETRAPPVAGGVPPHAAALACALLLASAIAPSAARAQYRRHTAVPYVGAVRAGALYAGLGAGYRAGWAFPLSGLRGDLLRLGQLELLYGLGRDGVLTLRGDVYRVLAIEERGPSHVRLEPGVEDGTTADAGDFELGTLVRLAGRPRGLSGGLHLAVQLPNSDESKGLGSNTTNVRTSLFATYATAAERLRATVDVGVAILESPLESFVQNDVLVYSADVLYRLPDSPVRVHAALDSRASTRGRVPVGTEDRGELRFGVDAPLGGWRVDVGTSVGIVGNAGDWGLEAGLSRTVPP